jgi:flavocytochrome c
MKKKITALLLAAAMVLCLLTGCGGGSSSSTAAPSSTADSSIAGTYEGTGAGRNGDIVVAVTLDDAGKITNIEVKSHEETEGVGTLAFDQMIPLMVESGSIAVDTVATATLSSNGLLEAVRNALTAAGVDPDTYANAVETAQGEDTVYNVDVVIVGGGGAGMAAAASAAGEGASVLVLEKTAAIGGNTKLGEGTYNCADPELQSILTMTADNCKEVEEAISVQTDDPEYQALMDDVRADYEAWQASGSTALFDSTNWHALQTYIGGGSIDNIALIRTYAEKAPETLEWLEDTIGVPFKSDYVFMAIGGKWARGHQVDLVAATGKESDNGGKVYIDKLNEYAVQFGTIIETSSTVTSLLMDSTGAVVGCEATRADGSKITANAKSVILTTGGYAANSDLVLKYSNGVITTTMTSCATSSTGDGLGLAEDVGASLINLDQIQVHPLGDPIDDCGCVSEFVGNWLSATEYMFVNKEGERFINEDNTRYAISMAELEQTDGQMWLIVDSSEIADDNTRDELINRLLNDGHSYVADTLDELAEKIGVPADTLKATVETYNEGMLSGTDEFGKATSPDSVIEQGPFYASLRTPTVHYTMGGIAINENAEVLDTNGNAIPGLYAAGEVTSGIHGNNRLGGNAYPDIMTFGRIAGLNAAAK